MHTQTSQSSHDKPLVLGEPKSLAEVREMVAACMQCGTCSASCPNVDAMDMTPRRMWRLVLFGQEDAVLTSKTMFLCSSCYTCTLRCPRGLPLTSAIYALKRAAAERDERAVQKRHAFYKAFVDNVRTYGRVQESMLMTKYFLAMRDPFLPLGFTGLGLKLMAKGKLHGPSSKHKGRLTAIFDKVKEMEGGA
ncbi:MAG: 4Fe-4S dicluster domain-containing protein [Desulfovibrio sp.]|nr:MAG: 4Fe-4S dicluster domain-containing protein [Desulfovibrio sp.]